MIFVLYIGQEKSRKNADVLSTWHYFKTNCMHCQHQEEKEILEAGQGSKSNDTLPIQTQDHVVKELQSGSGIPGKEKQEK